jgi:hypothetical protein
MLQWPCCHCCAAFLISLLPGVDVHLVKTNLSKMQQFLSASGTISQSHHRDLLSTPDQPQLNLQLTLAAGEQSSMGGMEMSPMHNEHEQANVMKLHSEEHKVKFGAEVSAHSLDC